MVASESKLTPEPESRRIEREIDQTREQLDRTVDAIQERLSPRYIAGGIMDSITQGAQAGSRSISQSIRDNPVPAALIGAGVLWMIMERSRKNRQVPSQFPGVGAARGVGDRIQEGAHAAGQWAKDAGEKIACIAGTAKEQVAQAGHKVSEGATTAAQAAAHAAQAAAHRVALAGGKARETVQHARQSFWSTYEENPLVIGAAAFAVGLIGGATVPTTSVEDRIMGRAARQLKDKVRAAGERAMEAGREIAGKAADAAQSAQGEQMGERIANAAECALTAAAEEAGRQARSLTGARETGRNGGGRDGNM